MKIYALGGLGADKRTFNYITLNNHQLVCLDWLIPANEETIESYAQRMCDLIDKDEPFAVLGVSFGGMIMTEVSKLCNAEHTILISSVCKSSELRWIYRAAGKFNLDKIIPYKLIVGSTRLVHYLFGVKLMRDKELLKAIMEDMDPAFISWAISVIVRWKNEVAIDAVRIHGEKDRVLPVNNKETDHLFKGAGHFIIVNEAENISKIIDQLS